MAVCLLQLTSCNKDYVSRNWTEPNVNPIEVEGSIDTSGVIKIESLQELSEFIGNSEKSNYSPLKSTSLRNFPIATVSGYSSCAPRYGRANEKINFGKYSAELGVDPNKIYIVDFCEAKKQVTLPAGSYFIPVLSPECGYAPGLVESGYSVIKVGDTYTMTTNLTHIKFDTNGRKVDIWAPIQPNKLKWRYGVVQP